MRAGKLTWNLLLDQLPVNILEYITNIYPTLCQFGLKLSVQKAPSP